MNLLDFNKHWEKNLSYNFKIKRIYFKILKETIKNKKYINLIVWLRRVWKTTLMFQLIDDLIKSGIQKYNILYYSFDWKLELEELINEYLKISNNSLENDKIFLFLDEIQKLDDWQNKIKIYYDLYPNLKIIATGSSSLFLKSNESLAWRIETTTIKTLFFEEFLEFKNLSYLLEKPKLYYKKIILEFEKYLYRQFYDTINLNLFEAKKYNENLKNKIIKQDAKNYFKIKHIDIMIQIFEIIRKKPWMILDYTNLANDLWLDARTIQTYIYYLEESFLIKKIYNFSKNLISSEKKQKKVYLNWTSFYNWTWEVNGELFENYIQNKLDLKYFYRFWKKEVDFVKIWKNDEIEAIELKYKSKIKKEDYKNLDFFEKKFGICKKIIISKDETKKLWDNIKNLNFLENLKSRK